MHKAFSMKHLTLIGMMGSLASVLMLFRFPLPFMPPFLSFDLAGVPELIGGFALGPFSAFLIILVKILIQLIISGSKSMLVGELQGLMLSCAMVLPAAIIYQKNKTRNGAIKGMIAGALLCIITAVITNLTMIIPFYINLYGMTMDSIVSSSNSINPLINDVSTLALIGILPFNIIKTAANCVVTLIVYKKISGLIHKYL